MKQFSSRSILAGLLSLGAAALLYYQLRGTTSVSELNAGLRSIDASILLIYLLMAFAALLVRAIRYRVICRALVTDAPSTGSFVVITAIRNVCVDLLPARLGAVVYLVLLKRVGVPFTHGAVSVGVLVVFDMLALAALLIGAFLVLPSGSLTSLPASLEPQVAAAAIALLLGTFLALRALPWLLRSVGRLCRAIASRVRSDRFQHIFTPLAERLENDSHVLSDFRLNMKLFALTCLLRLLKYGALLILLYGVFLAAGLPAGEVKIGVSLVAFVVAEAAASLPISGIMGFGAYELSWNSIFSAAHEGILTSKALGGIFALHLVTQVSGFILLIVVLMWVLSFDGVRRREWIG